MCSFFTFLNMSFFLFSFFCYMWSQATDINDIATQTFKVDFLFFFSRRCNHFWKSVSVIACVTRIFTEKNRIETKRWCQRFQYTIFYADLCKPSVWTFTYVEKNNFNGNRNNEKKTQNTFFVAILCMCKCISVCAIHCMVKNFYWFGSGH